MMQRHSQSESVFRAITLYSQLSPGPKAFIIQLRLTFAFKTVALHSLFVHVYKSIHPCLYIFNLPHMKEINHNLFPITDVFVCCKTVSVYTDKKIFCGKVNTTEKHI